MRFRFSAAIAGSVMVGLVVCSSVFAADDSLSLQDLFNLSVTTASKTEQKLAEATSIMSVITRQEIEASGLPNVFELLKRVPGFYSTRSGSWPVITSRGLTSDGNDHFLLLVDGHQQNSILGQGYQQQDLIPNLDQVERIEIVRGPGSVLWGSSAVMGIISIITKDKIDKDYHVSVRAQSGDGLVSETVQKDLSFGNDVKGLISFTHFNSNGFYKSDVASTAPSAHRVDANRIFPNEQNTLTNQIPFDMFHGSWDMYSKVKIANKTTVIARVMETNMDYFWDRYAEGTSTLSDLKTRKAYLDLRSSIEAAKNVNIEYNVYGDFNLQSRNAHDLTGRDSNDPGLYNPPQLHTRMQDLSDEEFTIGGEVTADWKISDNQRFKGGVKYVWVDSGENRDTKVNIAANRPFVPSLDNPTAATPPPNPGFFGLPPAEDKTIAVYGEYAIDLGIPTFFAGLRAEHNDYREKGTIFLPRGGVILKLTPEITAKAMINSGFLRPNARYSKSQGTIVSAGGTSGRSVVTKSEKILEYDLQASYQTNDRYFALTGFLMKDQNFITYVGQSFESGYADVAPGGSPASVALGGGQGYKNLGDVKTVGFEAEGKYKLGNFVLYGNYSYAKSNIPDGYWDGIAADSSGAMLNFPKHIFNLGTNYFLTDATFLNVNLNVARQMPISYTSSGLTGYANWTKQEDVVAMRAYLDAALTSKIVGIDGTVYCDNITDDTGAVGFAANNGTYKPRGRTVGIRLAYGF